MAVAAVLSSKKCLSFGRASKRLLEVVESELEKGRFFDYGACFFEHFGGSCANNGDADFADAGTEKLWGYAGHIRSHVYNRGILQIRESGCKFLLKQKVLSRTLKLLAPISWLLRDT